MNITFHVVDGAKPGQVTLTTPISIGRGRETKLTLPLPLISRVHCEIYEQQGGIWIRDLGSTNGTKVDGRQIAAPTTLDPGQQISIGSVTLRVDYQTTPGSAASTPTADLEAELEPYEDLPPTVDAPAPIADPSQPNAAPPAAAPTAPTPFPTANPAHPAPQPVEPQPAEQPPAEQQPPATPQNPAPGAIPMALPIQPADEPPAAQQPPAEQPSAEPDDDDLDEFLKNL